MKPEVAVFTKDRPCTKKEIWSCFKTVKTGFAKVQIDVAHAIIGKNVPRVMERNGYLVVDKLRQGDYYKLTPEGEAWLLNGIRAYIKNHPAEADEIEYLPSNKPVRQRRIRAS